MSSFYAFKYTLISLLHLTIASCTRCRSPSPNVQHCAPSCCVVHLLGIVLPLVVHLLDVLLCSLLLSTCLDFKAGFVVSLVLDCAACHMCHRYCEVRPHPWRCQYTICVFAKRFLRSFLSDPNPIFCLLENQMSRFHEQQRCKKYFSIHHVELFNLTLSLMPF